MNLRVWVSAVIFAGSYLPLALILLVQHFGRAHTLSDFCLEFWSSEKGCLLPFQQSILPISVFAICVVCFLVALLTLASVPTKHKVTIVSAKHTPAELMNYTLPYVVSFIGAGYHEPSKFVGIIIFLAWMFWITHKSGQIILNPILVVFGWRLYELEIEFPGKTTRYQTTALVDGDVAAGDQIRQGSIQDVLIAKLIQDG